MRKLYISLLLVSCGSLNKPEDHKPDIYRDSTLQVYVDAFQRDADKRNIQIDMSQVRIIEWNADLESLFDTSTDAGFVVGLCITYEQDNKNRITKRVVSTEVWKEIHILDTYKDVDMLLIKEVMYHELGHCVLNKDHVENPTRIMNPAINININDISIRWESMVDDLFYNI